MLLPNQRPFSIEARLLAFNGRVDGRRAVLVHGASTTPPTVAVIPFLLRGGSGRFGTSLSADLPRALGPWPRFAHFELTLGRRYRHGGRARSYISASCPIPRRFTAGFFSFARIGFRFADGRRLGTAIARGCRAR